LYILSTMLCDATSEQPLNLAPTQMPLRANRDQRNKRKTKQSLKQGGMGERMMAVYFQPPR
jgi:hypothetical protein